MTCTCAPCAYPHFDPRCPEHGKVTPVEESYDQRQIGAVLITWICCNRTVWAVAPEKGCFKCRA